MNKREEIPKLAKELIFLSADRRQYLMDNYQKISDAAVAKFHNFLTKAITKQDEIVAEEMRKNPNLVHESKDKILKAHLAKINQMEDIANAQESKELQELELELNNII